MMFSMTRFSESYRPVSVAYSRRSRSVECLSRYSTGVSKKIEKAK